MQRFLLHCPAVTALREFGLPGVELDHLPASTSSQAGQERDKHPKGTASDRASKLLLPRPVGDLFQLEAAAQRQDPMGELPVAALARGSEPAVHLAPLRLHPPLALAYLPAFLPFLDAALLIIVLRVVRAALPVECPFQAAQALPVGGHLGAERLEQGLLLSHHR